MARPQKLTLDFFIHDKDARCDRKIRALRRKHGNDGYATYFCLLEMICDEDGLSLNLASTLELETAVEDCGLRDSAHFFKVLHTCVDLGLFDKQLWESERVIFSHALHRRYVARLEDRKAAAIRQKRSREAKALQSKLSDAKAMVVTRDNPVTTPLSQNCHSTEYRTTELQNSDTKTEIPEVDRELTQDIPLDLDRCEPTEPEEIIADAMERGVNNGAIVPSVTTEQPLAAPGGKAKGKFSQADFDHFWNQTLWKIGKAKAVSRFLAIPKSEPATLDEIISAWTQQQQWHLLNKGTLQYLKRPETWIHNKGWNDQMEPVSARGLNSKDVVMQAEIQRQNERMKAKFSQPGVIDAVCRAV